MYRAAWLDRRTWPCNVPVSFVVNPKKIPMPRIFFLCAASLLFFGCKKEKSARVGIYLLRSFSQTVDTSVVPAIVSISNAVLESAPLVADEDIQAYQTRTATFCLKKEIKAIIKDYGPDKAFAVALNNEPVYFGRFHPAYLSSISFGVATIDPVLTTGNKLEVQFAAFPGSAVLSQLDKRNNRQLLAALKASGRLQ